MYVVIDVVAVTTMADVTISDTMVVLVYLKSHTKEVIGLKEVLENVSVLNKTESDHVKNNDLWLAGRTQINAEDFSVCEVSLDDRLELVSLTFAVQCVWSSHPPPPVQQEHGGQGGGGGDQHPLLLAVR